MDWSSSLGLGVAAAAARRFAAIAVAGLLVCATAAAAAENDDAFRANRWLGRGVNLGNALDAPSAATWAVRLRGDYFEAIKTAGFDSVRIPVAWSLHTAPQPPYAIEPSFLAKVDWAIDQALTRGLTVVLDDHHDIGMEQKPEQNLARLTATWEQLARHYQGFSDRLFFELLNEPSGALSDAKWQEIMPALLRTVRESNPTRTVIVGPGYWNSVDHLDRLELPPEDRHIIATIHYYTPLPFTHQGAGWMPGSDKWKGTTWTGTAQETAALDRDLDKAAAWSARNSRPVYLGEFGAYQAADMDSRANWTRAVAQAARKRGFSFAYWEFCSTFGAYDPVTLKWRPPLLEALMADRASDRR